MSSKKTRAAGESIGFLFIVFGILGVLNVLGYFFDLGRLDMTEAKLWSLSDGSKRVAGALEDRMEITAYFTADLPPPFNGTEVKLRDLLQEYAAASGGNIRVTFVDPDTDEAREKAEEDGVRRVSHQVIENDAVSVREGYRGMVIKYLGETKAVPVIQDTEGLEYLITQTIKEMLGDRRPVGVLGGHESPSLSEGLTGLRDSLPTYELREVSAADEIDQDLAALLIVSPETELSEDELRHIDQYVMRGGSLGIFGGGVKLSMDGPEPTAQSVSTGLNRLLEAWGVRLNDDMVGDFQCQRAPMRGPMGIQVAVPYPPVPIVGFDEGQREHPALFRLPSAVLPFVSSLSVMDAQGEFEVTTLARSSENSWKMSGESIRLTPRHPREWGVSGETGPFPLVVAIEGTLPSAFASAAPTSGEESSSIGAPPQSESPVRVLVAGTGAFLRDEFLPPPGPDGQRQLSGGIALALNSVDWLAQESDLIAIRAKNVEDPPLEVPAAVQEAEDAARQAAESEDGEAVEAALETRSAALESWESKKRAYRWLNTLGIPFAFALFGVLRWRLRVAKKASFKL